MYEMYLNVNLICCFLNANEIEGRSYVYEPFMFHFLCKTFLWLFLFFCFCCFCLLVGFLPIFYWVLTFCLLIVGYQSFFGCLFCNDLLLECVLFFSFFREFFYVNLISLNVDLVPLTSLFLYGLSLCDFQKNSFCTLLIFTKSYSFP